MSGAASVLLWGGRGSGKSGFVGALWQAGGTSDDATGRWAISPGDIHDSVTKNYLIDAYAMLRDGQRRATMPSSEYPDLRMTARKWVAGSPRAALDLSFTDPAGEYADDAMRARQQGGALLDKLMGAGGIVWLFDCLSESRPYLDQVVRQIGTLRQRSGGGAIRTPVAFCLSRIDLLSDENRAWACANPEAALRHAVGDDVMAQLEGAFPNHRCFAISSRGLTPGRVDPIGLNDVLSWIHANQRMDRVASFGRRWYRHAAIAAVLLVLGIVGARAARDYFYGAGAAERQRSEQRALGQLELAGRLFAQGEADSALMVLRTTELSSRHERAVERDTLMALAAHQLGAARVLAGATDADSLLALAIEHSERAAKKLRDPAAAARMRFVHAEACMLSECGRGDIRDDLEFVEENAGDDQLRRAARDRLADVRR